MTDCRDYKEILQGESLDSTDIVLKVLTARYSSDWEPSGETLGSQDTWSSQSSEDCSSSQDSSPVASQDCKN